MVVRQARAALVVGQRPVVVLLVRRRSPRGRGAVQRGGGRVLQTRGAGLIELMPRWRGGVGPPGCTAATASTANGGRTRQLLSSGWGGSGVAAFGADHETPPINLRSGEWSLRCFGL